MSIAYYPVIRSSYQLSNNVQQVLARQLINKKLGKPVVPFNRPVTGLPDSGMAILGYELDPVYTLGRRQKLPEEEMKKLRFEDADVVKTSRGGHTTFHGPGQLVMYPVVDLRVLKLRVRDYIDILEVSIVNVLQKYGISAEQRAGAGLNGVWIQGTNNKIASIGVHCQMNITTFGIGLNVCTNPKWFNRIVACNLPTSKIVSIADILPLTTNRTTSSPPSVSEVGLALATELLEKLQRENRILSYYTELHTEESLALIEACAPR